MRGLSPGFNSLQTGKHIQSSATIARICATRLSFNSLQTGKHIQRAPILSPVGPWLWKPKTKRELRGAIFERNFSLKIPQTHVYIELYAIFWANRLRSQVTPMFLGDFCCVRTRSVHRVCGISLKYTRNPEKCQTDISQKHAGVSIYQ